MNGRGIRIASIALAVAIVIPFVFWTGKFMAEQINFYKEAIAHIRAGELPKAAAALGLVQEQDKDCHKDARFFIVSGMIYDAQGKHEQAQQRYEHAITLIKR